MKRLKLRIWAKQAHKSQLENSLKLAETGKIFDFSSVARFNFKFCDLFMDIFRKFWRNYFNKTWQHGSKYIQQKNCKLKIFDFDF